MIYDIIPAITKRVRQICRRFGKFRPRFAPVKAFESMAESLAILGNEEAVLLKPSFVRYLEAPNIVIVPIADKGATWEVFVAWQQGKVAGPIRVLLDALDRGAET